MSTKVTPPPTPPSGPLPQHFDALRSLYEGQLGTLRALSERSFATTLQTLTLVVAGLVGGKINLALSGKVIGSGVLLAFNASVVIYLISKSRAHHREKTKLGGIESRLVQLAGWPHGHAASEGPSFWRSFLGGSGLMVLSVVLAGTCACAGLWIPLVEREAPADVSVILKSVPPASPPSQAQDPP